MLLPNNNVTMRFLLLSIFLLAGILAKGQRTEFILEQGWKFSKGNFENAAQVNFDDSKWENVTVPHDWAIYGPFDKEVDKQVVAITQNNEKEATEKTGRTAGTA
jgi:beta-galactosidase